MPSHLQNVSLRYHSTLRRGESRRRWFPLQSLQCLEWIVCCVFCHLLMESPCTNLVVLTKSILIKWNWYPSFEVVVSHPSNWSSCTFDFRLMSAQHVFTTIRRYGHLIKSIRIRGFFSLCLKERLCIVPIWSLSTRMVLPIFCHSHLRRLPFPLLFRLVRATI